jgi:hypothetical protein
MRRGIFICFALSICLGALPCGADPTPMRARGRVESEAPQLEAILAKLNLSRRQKLQIAKILKESKAVGGDDREATLRKVGAVLSEEQKQTLQAELQAQKSRSAPPQN